jgi:NAD(P)-dependent dehydrogenase (short-subunit alcohol dehydrogenase family)
VRYQGKVVVVTGGSKGIGLGCVRAFVEQGGSEVVFCARNALRPLRRRSGRRGARFD